MGCGSDAASGGDGGSAGSSGGSAGTGGSAGSGGATGGSGGSSGSAGSPSEKRMLISADWTLAGGSEFYQCTRLTVTEDLYITEFHPVIPLGTHHTVLTLQSPGAPDGTAECADPFEGGPRQIYGTGVGSQPMKLPAGTAIKIASGQQLHLNLHLFNVGGAELSGTSAIEVVTTTADQIEHEAELHIWGKTEGLVIPPSSTSEHSASCLVPAASNLFIMQPHMHQIGKHLKLTHTPAGGAQTVLFDQDYSFDAQVHVGFEPLVALGAGDDLTITCTYDNPYPQEVTFGESSTDEMCFAGLWVYPAGAPFCL
jgi:hypothetical protein